MTEKLILNGIEFFVKRTERNSIGITVERNGSVTVHAPLKADLRAVERFISSKTLWIHQKLAYKKETNRGKVVRDFVSGQGFLYLGRSYRLRLVRDRIVTDKQNEALAPLNFRNGFFELLEKEKERAKDHFIQWYKKQTEKQLWARLPRYAQRIGVEVKDVKVLDLGQRWASCGRKGTLNFSWRIVMAPLWVFDYILVHELVHIIQRGHSRNFWRIVERAIPDYGKCETWLYEHGIELDI